MLHLLQIWPASLRCAAIGNVPRAEQPDFAGLLKGDMQCQMQGLDLDTSGRAISKPHFLARDKHTAEQEGWAQQSDKKTSEFLDSVQLRGGQAFQHAGVHLSLAVGSSMVGECG